MPTHKDDSMQLGSHGPEEVDTSLGFESKDVRETGIIVFLIALGIFVAVTGLLCWGIGKAINAHMDKEDGPNTKWTRTAEIRELGNLPTNPQMQNKVSEMVQQFPAPRLQEDDGNQEIADLHAREDLLLSNYTWADKAQGKIRIPIDQAIQILAKRGLPVAQQSNDEKLLTGESKPEVKSPLTSGFARTGYEQDLAANEEAESARAKHE